MTHIKIEKISFGYNGTPVLKDITFEASGGDMLAIIGQNGSGKSTLLKCICRILKIQIGRAHV